MFREFENEDDQHHVREWEPRVRWASWGDMRWEQTRLRTLGTLRLVCRLFADLVAPLLFPVLSIDVSQASLDLAAAISKNPAIAAGVRGVRVYLGRRPREYADSIARFRDVRLAAVKEMGRYFESELEFYDWGIYSAANGTGEGRQTHAQVGVGVGLCWTLESEWADDADEILDDADEILDDEDAVLDGADAVLDGADAILDGADATLDSGPQHDPPTEYQQILHDSHTEFRRKSEEQYRLLQHGTYASALAAAVARMPNAHSIGFFETQNYYRASDNLKRSLLTDDHKLLSQWMTLPLDREEIPYGTIASEECILPWELPIALSKAGASLAQIDIDINLMYRNFSAPSHDSQETRDRPGAAWDDLVAGCQNLEAFNLRLRIPESSVPAGEVSHLDNFLGAVLSPFQMRAPSPPSPARFRRLLEGGLGQLGRSLFRSVSEDTTSASQASRAQSQQYRAAWYGARSIVQRPVPRAFPGEYSRCADPRWQLDGYYRHPAREDGSSAREDEGWQVVLFLSALRWRVC